MEPRFVYVTCQDQAQAELIGRSLVKERLAACANVLPGMISFYWWEGKVASDPEVVLILKSTEELIPALTQRVKDLHSYEVPCVVALPIMDGNYDYLDWIDRSVGPAPKFDA